MFEEAKGQPAKLAEVLAGLRVARTKGNALSYSVRESVESIPMEESESAKLNFDGLEAASKYWKTDFLLDGTIWAQSGEKFYLREKTYGGGFDGNLVRTRSFIPVGNDGNSEKKWVANDVSIRGEGGRDALESVRCRPENPIYMASACQHLFYRECWLSDLLARKPATIRDLPNGRIEAVVTIRPGELTGLGLELLDKPMRWEDSQQLVLVLDSSRDYLLESSSSRTGTRVGELSRVFESRKVGNLWLPTRYIVPGNPTAGSRFRRFTLSDIQLSMSDKAFTNVFQAGDIRSKNPYSADEPSYRLTTGGEWKREATKDEIVQDKVAVEYGFYVLLLVVLILAGYLGLNLLRRARR